MAKRKSAAETAAPTAEVSSPEYTVLARRYRPQQFSDLVGQEPVTQALVNALQSNRVAHAYLFTGARGVGKTSAARILAKALNCVQGPTTKPCDQCEMCQAIAVGEDMDVLEIDGASNRGIDEVREIRQNVQFRPSRGRYKVYIIDEVHMLTTPAFNALLKTLEEPPAHVKFIFATTEVQKIPITILSRCQRFDFAGIGVQKIVERLREIVASEKMQAEDDALHLIARRAGGSMRDGQSLLDQLLSFGGERLTTDQVHQLLGTANEDRIAGLAEAILERNPTKALDILGQVVDQGQQLGELIDQLCEYWRDLMVVQCTGQENQAASVTGNFRQALKKQAGLLKLDTILAGLDILVTTKTRLRSTSHGRVLLEMALVRLSRLEDLVSLTQLAQWLGREGGGLPTQARPAVANVPPSTASVVTPGSQTSLEKKKEPLEPANPFRGDTLPLTKETLPQVWTQILSEVGFALASELRKAEVAISGPNTLVLRLPPGYNLLLDATRQGQLEAVVRKVTGQTWQFRVETDVGTQAGEKKVESLPPAESSVERARRLRTEVAQLPLVKKAKEVFGAEIIQMDEDFGTLPAPASPAEEPDSLAAEEGEKD
jgi:DNA polymerase-3 subunit gamma/tau